VGTGSGCIAVALAKELPDAELWAIDISSAALAIAQENAQRHGVAERIHFMSGDLFAPLRNLTLDFSLIVSNPPYIAQPDLVSLQSEVQEWEPHFALDGGTDGLDFYSRLLQEGPHYLQAGGWLVMEIGHDQGQAVLQLAQQQLELTNSTCLLDYEGRERVVLTQKKPGKFPQN
jgi:release factor glutamine methyltransferase